MIAGLVPLLLAGCTIQQANNVQLAADQTLVWPLQQESKIAYDETLDPAVLSTLYDFSSIEMLYVGLVRLDSSLNVQPDAATAMPDVSPDGLKYTFHLRQGMKFSDGQPLTAKDFAFSIDRALDPNICLADKADPADPNTDTATYGQCYYAGSTYLNHILGANDRINGNGYKDHSVVNPTIGSDDARYGVNVLDDFTLVIRLDSPIAYFLESLTYPTSFAVEQSLVEKYPHGKWVDHLDVGGCSGPFMVKSYGDGTQMTMVPNPSWGAAWGQQISLKQVVRPLVQSADDEFSSYLKGQYDYTDVPADQYQTAHGQGDFHELPMLATSYFGLNWQRAPFDNEEVRQAFALALNKQLLVDRVENGGAIPSNHIVPRGMPGYDANLQLLTKLDPNQLVVDTSQSLTGNQAAAQKLLADAKGKCPSFLSISDKAHQYCRFIGGSQSYSTTTPPVHACKYSSTAAPGEIDLYTNKDDTPSALAKGASDEWNSVLGVNVKVIPISFGELLHRVIFETDPLCRSLIWNIGWSADYPDPQDWLSLQFASNAGNNSSGVNDPTLDALMLKADTDPVVTVDQQQKRMADYNAAEQRIIDEVAWIPYQQAKFSWRERTWVQAGAGAGLPLNAQDFVPDVAWANVTILQH